MLTCAVSVGRLKEAFEADADVAAVGVAAVGVGDAGVLARCRAFIDVLRAVAAFPSRLAHARAVVLHTLHALLDVAGALLVAVHAPLARRTHWSKDNY